MTLTQWLAIWFIVAVLASPFIGYQLHKRRTRIDRERCARLEKLVDLADELETAATSMERQRIYRRAEALGFIVTERDKAWEGPFMLDEQTHPHPKDAA